MAELAADLAGVVLAGVMYAMKDSKNYQLFIAAKFLWLPGRIITTLNNTFATFISLLLQQSLLVN